MEHFEQWIKWWTEVLATALEPIAFAAASAALLAGVVLAINVSFRRWLNAGQMALLWGLVLIRLALPMAPQSSVSLGTLWNRATAAAETLTKSDDPIVIPTDLMPQLESANAVPPDATLPESSVSPASAAAAEVEADPLWVRVLCPFVQGIVVVFPFVMLGMIAWTGFVHRRLCLFLRRQAPTNDERLIRVLGEARALAGLSRSVRLYAIAEQQQPAVMGLWSPTILLPLEAVELSDDRLRLLLLHELAHVRRGDVIVNWSLMLLKAVHWWNPVFWLASSRFGALREQACDAFALARSKDGSARDYGEMLLHFASTGRPRSRWSVSISAAPLGISSSRGWSAVKRRLKALRSATWQPNVLQRGLFAAAATALAVSGWTEAIEARPPVADPWFPAVSGTWDSNVVVEETKNFVTAEVDVSEVLERQMASGASREESAKELISLVEMMVRGARRGSGSWEDVKLEPGEVRIEDNKLKLTAGQSTVDEISRLLKVWGTTGLRQICLECRIIKVDGDLGSQVGVRWKSVGQSKRPELPVRPMKSSDELSVTASAAVEHLMPVCVGSLNESQTRQLVRDAQKNRNSNIRFAPKITVFNGSTAQLSTTQSQPFVVGAQESNAGELKPTINTVEEGLTLTLRPVQNVEGTQVNLTGRLELSDIADVTTAAARMKSGREVNVQIPRVNRLWIDVDSVVPDGETLLIGCLPSYERREFVYLMITPRWLKDIDDRDRKTAKK